jgi:hypothetical protein
MFLSLLVAFEILHRALMGFGLLNRRKSSQVAALAGLRIFLARIQTVLARLQLANHVLPRNSIIEMTVGRHSVAFRMESDHAVAVSISGEVLFFRCRRLRAITAIAAIIGLIRAHPH